MNGKSEILPTYWVVTPGPAQRPVQWRRRESKLLARLLHEHGATQDRNMFVCGPATMTDDVLDALHGLGVPRARYVAAGDPNQVVRASGSPK